MVNGSNPKVIIRTEILNLLDEKDYTVEGIEMELKKNPNIKPFTRNLLWVYMNQFKREGKVEEVEKKDNNFKRYRKKKPIQKQPLKPKKVELDTLILKKLIIPFAKAGIKVNLEQEEEERVKELFAEVNKDG
ncbi:MAG: hypothetical protein GY870_13170 [archaeon]|nr:hypothetical protein [archaeon]